MSTTHRLAALGLHLPEVLLPAPTIDLERWAVIACDQFTSDPEYWAQVEVFVGDAPSTLRIVLPEIYIGEEALADAADGIKATMRDYLERNTFRTVESSAVYVRRRLPGGEIRRGIVIALDLEYYDYHRNSDSIVRASEETIPSRLPTRIAIREGAALETPHVLVLFEDPEFSVVEVLESIAADSAPLYETKLMMNGGEVEGFRIAGDGATTAELADAFENLISRDQYGFLFATGDGNHSLAAAKEVWEAKKRAGAAPDDPTRYCLVELVNIHDPGLPVHPIHRIAAADEGALLEELLHRADARFHGLSATRLIDHLERDGLSSNEIGFLGPAQAGILSLPDGYPLPVGIVDEAIASVDARSVDYTHGTNDTVRAAQNTESIAVFLPEIDRATLFPTIARDGALPRKAFSLGEARDKRYYLECRAL